MTTKRRHYGGADELNVSTRHTAAPSRRWTQTEVSQLRSALLASSTINEIAHQLNRSAEEVRLLMTQLRLRST